MLKDILPAGVRSKLYTIYAVLALALGATQVGFASADAGQPEWLTVTLAVFVFVGAGLGFTANANTPSADDGDGKHVAARGHISVGRK